MKIGLFIPCYIDAFFPEVGIATLELLERLGCEVEYPLEQTCCGQPMANSGCQEDAPATEAHFVDCFKDFEIIVGPSGSCVHHVRFHPKVELGLCGDVRETIKALLPLLEPKTDRDFLYQILDKHEGVYRKLRTYVDKITDRRPIHPEYVAARLDELAGPNAVFTFDVGMCTVWAARYLRAAEGRRFLGSLNHGSMANALSQAIGAQLTYPDRPVVALCGDGGLAMLMGELLTVFQYELPIKILVFNNHSLGMVQLEMEVAGFPPFGVDLKNPNFALLAQAIGLMGVRVEDPAQVRPELERVLASGGPALIDVVTDANVLAMPPKAKIQQAKGFALSMTKMAFTGELDDVMDTVMANWKNF